MPQLTLTLLEGKGNLKGHPNLTHLAETQDEDAYCLRTYGKRPLQLMEEWEFVGQDVSYAHGIGFDDRELDTLARTGTAVCHCPSSNMRLGSGIARVKEMLERGITVSLAVDGRSVDAVGSPNRRRTHAATYARTATVPMPR